MNIFDEVKDKLDGVVEENVTLAPYTTFKIGGPAKYFYAAKDDLDFVEILSAATKLKVPYFILGGGSNVLVSDYGFDGLVIVKKRRVLPNDFRIEGTSVFVDAPVMLLTLVKGVSQAGLTGLEWAAGIPGSVGGAVRGNAGAYGGQMSDIVKNVSAVCDFKTRKREVLDNKQLKFGYRTSAIKKELKDCIILSIELELKKGDKKEILKTVNEILEKRKINTIVQYPSAGCIFKNPVVDNKKILGEFEKDKGKKSINGKVPAGYLIDKLGLRGKKMGGAMIGETNANFIVNVDHAKASDVIMLISFIKQQVRDNYGIQLHEEVELVGF